jgi:hypothetical protein
MARGSDLVATNDHRTRVPGSDRLGLGNGEAQSPFRRVFPSDRLLTDLRPDRLKR